MSKVPDIQMIPIESITVLNPRSRNKKVFGELVTSIARLGLKKPITVAPRTDKPGYSLVCGQGRLEAFMALGQSAIPAMVISASTEDCFVMSLVENLARRQHSPIELMREIGALRKRGYSIPEIAKKTDFSDEYIYAICFLLEKGEDRLLAGVERGVIPATIALEIVRANDADVQSALAEAYERRTLPGNQVLAIRRIVENRAVSGKGSARSAPRTNTKKKVTADSLVRAYRRETDRQKLMIKRATMSQSRLLFVVNAVRHLMADENYVTLLRAEGLTDLPRPLAERLEQAQG